MAQGFVKWFNNAKGYGFVCVDDIAEDIIVHFSVIEMEGFRTLRMGEPVLLQIGRNDRGFHALRVVPASQLSIEQHEDLKAQFRGTEDWSHQPPSTSLTAHHVDA